MRSNEVACIVLRTGRRSYGRYTTITQCVHMLPTMTQYARNIQLLIYIFITKIQRLLRTIVHVASYYTKSSYKVYIQIIHSLFISAIIPVLLFPAALLYSPQYWCRIMEEGRLYAEHYIHTERLSKRALIR